MKRIVIVVAVMALLVGCASVSELRMGEPYASLSTTKAPQATAECIRDAWQDQRIGIEANGAVMQRSGNTITVISPASGIPQEIADISAKGQVSFYVQKSLNIGHRERDRAQAIRTCI